MDAPNTRPQDPRSSSPSHRLPTLSASQVLLDLKSLGPEAISTGLSQLDQLLSPPAKPRDPTGGESEGFLRGQIAEIYGPPGVGKTTLALQVCCNALSRKGHVVWIDAAAPLNFNRLDDILKECLRSQNQTADADKASKVSDEARARFHHYYTPTLAHLLAMILHAPSSFPPPGTSFLAIDPLSTLFDAAFPRESRGRGNTSKSETARWSANRRFAVRAELMAGLSKMAAMRNLAVLTTCQTVTRVRHGMGAVLLPSLSGVESDRSISTRLVLFRDWPLHQDGHPDDRPLSRFIGICRTNGTNLADEGDFRNVIPFDIDEGGLRGYFHENDQAAEVTIQPVLSPKKSRKRVFLEIADSEDEEYGSDDVFE